MTAHSEPLRDTTTTTVRCGLPTVKGRPCRRRLMPFGLRQWMCPVHFKPRQIAAGGAA